MSGPASAPAVSPAVMRDVLGNFAVIADRRGNAVCLLAGRHRYVIQEA